MSTAEPYLFDPARPVGCPRVPQDWIESRSCFIKCQRLKATFDNRAKLVAMKLVLRLCPHPQKRQTNAQGFDSVKDSNHLDFD